MRFKAFYITIITVFVIVAFRLFFLQVVKGKYFFLRSQRNAIRIIPEHALRGNILDRNGTVLVQDRLALNVAIIPQSLTNDSGTFRELAKTLSLTEEGLKLKFRKNISAPFVPVSVAEDIDRQKALLIAEKANKLPGVLIGYEPIRQYLYGTSLAHALGYLGMPQEFWTDYADYGFSVVSYVGVAGVEKYLDRFLRGVEGGKLIEVDNQGRQITTLGLRIPRKGQDITLTIDIRVQKILDELIASRKGAVILMNPFNGEIIAMANSPSFDPESFVKKTASRQRQSYLSDPDAPLFNRAVSGEYPPGSVFKLITAIAGLSTKKINPTTVFFCPGEKLIGRRVFKCWSEHGTQNLKEAIVHSCNVYFYTVGILTGAESLYEYAKVFNLGKRTGIDLPEESAGFLPNPRWQAEVNQQKWYQGDTANMAIGQGGLLLTPLQVVRMVSAIANSGYLVQPHLIRKVAEKRVIYKNPSKININPKYLLFLREAMRKVVEEETGTAHNINFADFAIAAKTGTAQIPEGRKHGWVVGFAPYTTPKIAFVIFMERSQGGIAASEFAREFFNRLAAEKLLLFE